MKTMITAIFIVALVAGIATAGIIGIAPQQDKDIPMDKDKYNALASIGLADNIQQSNITCNGHKCCVHLFKDGAINTDVCTSQTYCEEAEMLDPDDETNTSYMTYCASYPSFPILNLTETLDKLVDKRLEGIADATISRQTKTTIDIGGGGTITVSDKDVIKPK